MDRALCGPSVLIERSVDRTKLVVQRGMAALFRYFLLK
jgi:hypothetical protein